VARLILLNLDAELEWAGVRAAASSERAARWAAQVTPFWEASDRLWRGRDDALPGAPGYAWGSTPRALEVLRQAGAVPVGCAPVEIAARANHRGFAAPFASGLPRAGFARSTADVQRLLASARPGESWWAKQAWSWAARGRRVFDPHALQPADEAFLAKAVANGGVQLEPRVELLEEWALHGWIDDAGAVRFGAWSRQAIDAHGQWRDSSTVPEGPAGERAASEETAARIARALLEIDYRGPFGVDGYRYRDASGGRAWRFAGDVNARFTMGWQSGGLGLPAR
jgi:hypothetical protein